jgi:hypothetical protein
MDEEELRKCPICNGALNYCDMQGEKSFCAELFSQLKEGKITNEEFIEKLGKKIDVDKMIEHVVKHETR